MSAEFADILVDDGTPPFAPVAPPFNFNAADVAAFAPEITGFRLLDTMRKRLGWSSFAGKSLLDFGCGVRCARTIYNLGLDFGLYVGVDLHRAAIDWLKANLTDARFRFEHVDASNTNYNPHGREARPDALVRLDLPPCDAACMYSVITHQNPTEAGLTFVQLRRVVDPGGRLYFTAFVDANVDGYAEDDPSQPGLRSTYAPAILIDLVEQSGWRVDVAFPKTPLQQTTFLCTAV